MRLIDADKLPVDIKKDDIDNAPTIEAEPIKHGQWVNVTTPLLALFGDCRYECSNCGYYLDYKPNILDGKKGNTYCDCCGAKMDLKTLVDNTDNSSIVYVPLYTTKRGLRIVKQKHL